MSEVNKTLKPEAATDEEIARIKAGRLAGCVDPCVEVLSLFARIESDRAALKEAKDEHDLCHALLESTTARADKAEGLVTELVAALKAVKKVQSSYLCLGISASRAVDRVGELVDAALAKSSKEA